jgi:hypothetical protein
MVEEFHYLYFAMDFLEVRLIQLSFVDDLNGDLGKRGKRQKILENLRSPSAPCSAFARTQHRTTTSDIFLPISFTVHKNSFESLTWLFVTRCLASFTTAKLPLPMVFSMS